MIFQLGDKFYNKDGEVFRIQSIRSENKIYIKKNGSDKLESITKKELLDDYTRLIPLGKLIFSIVELDNHFKDVIISFFRTKDIDEGNSIPYAVCRQSILDIYTNLINRNPNITYVGVSTSVDTIPEDVNYLITLACNKVLKACTISVYPDDNMDDLYKYVKNLDEYDKILHDLCVACSDIRVRGYCKSVKQLIDETDFHTLFNAGMNIETMKDIVIKYSEETYELDRESRMAVEGLIKTEMFKTYVYPFDEYINLKAIKRSHVFVKDKTNKLYIIAYDEGKYINREYRDNIKDKRDAIAMLNHKKQHSKQ